MRPGSMPADSRDDLPGGDHHPAAAARATTCRRRPDSLANVRTPDIRRGDLRAQTAANRLARRRLEELVERRGRRDRRAGVRRGRRLRRAAHARGAARRCPTARYEAERAIEGDGVSDDDVPIRVAVTIDGDALSIDFAGTDDQVAGNVNCPLSVTRSACYFALRVLLPSDVPANAGTYAALLDRRRPRARSSTRSRRPRSWPATSRRSQRDRRHRARRARAGGRPPRRRARGR